MKEDKKIGILFICMGNICRSPMAEAVFRQRVKQTKLEHRIECDSAGTHDYHTGEPPDERAQRAASRRGYDMSGLRGRQVSTQDFEQFDCVLAMDRHNLELLERICPPHLAHKLSLYCDYHGPYAGGEVPDPYYGGVKGFEHVLDMIEEISDSLLEHVRQRIRP